MQRPITADGLADFYTRIGAAIWHVQYLEDALVNFITMKLLDKRRTSPETVTMSDGQELLAKKRKLTIGQLLQECAVHQIIRQEWRDRFEAFKENRHWLVHRSLVESGDDLYVSATREAILERIFSVQQEAISLKKLVANDLELWVAEHGVNMQKVQHEAEQAVRKLRSA